MVENTATERELSSTSIDLFLGTMREWLALNQQAIDLAKFYPACITDEIAGSDRGWSSLVLPMSMMHPHYLLTSQVVCGSAVDVLEKLMAGSLSLTSRTLVPTTDTGNEATVERDEEVAELRREIEELRRQVVRHEAACPIARRSPEALPPQL